MKPALSELTELQHFGVKGMKWGVRKDRPDARQIRAARRKIDGLYTARNVAAITGQPGKVKQIEKAIKDDPDLATSMRTTRGEKAALLLIGGPIGAVVIGAAAADRKRVERRQAKQNAGK